LPAKRLPSAATIIKLPTIVEMRLTRCVTWLMVGRRTSIGVIRLAEIAATSREQRNANAERDRYHNQPGLDVRSPL